MVRYALGAAAGPLAVSSYTYETLPEAERQALPDEAAISHALSGLGSSPVGADDDAR